jgi:hypothetical protein
MTSISNTRMFWASFLIGLVAVLGMGAYEYLIALTGGAGYRDIALSVKLHSKPELP